MSPASLLPGSTDFSLFSRDEQRLHTRYSIALDAEYRWINPNGRKQVGIGRTVNISTGGVLFEAKEPVGTFVNGHADIELAIRWPCLLDGVRPLNLVVRGRVVRVNNKQLAVRAKHHDFYTAALGRAKAAQAEDGRSSGR